MTNEHVKCAATEQHRRPITARDDWLVPSLQVRQLPRTSAVHAHNMQALKEKHPTQRRVARDSRSRGDVFEVWSVSEYHSGHLCWQTSTIDNAKWEITQLREKCSNHPGWPLSFKKTHLWGRLTSRYSRNNEANFPSDGERTRVADSSDYGRIFQSFFINSNVWQFQLFFYRSNWICGLDKRIYLLAVLFYHGIIYWR